MARIVARDAIVLQHRRQRAAVDRSVARHADRGILQVGDRPHLAARRREDHGGLAPHDHDRMGLAQQSGVGTHDRKVHLAGLERVGGVLGLVDLHEHQTDRRALRPQQVTRRADHAQIDRIGGRNRHPQLLRAQREVGRADRDRHGPENERTEDQEYPQHLGPPDVGRRFPAQACGEPPFAGPRRTLRTSNYASWVLRRLPE